MRASCRQWSPACAPPGRTTARPRSCSTCPPRRTTTRTPGRARRARARAARRSGPSPATRPATRCAHVAELDGARGRRARRLPVRARATALARRFLTLSIVRLPAWRWPGIVRHLRASATVTPVAAAAARCTSTRSRSPTGRAPARRRHGAARRRPSGSRAARACAAWRSTPGCRTTPRGRCTRRAGFEPRRDPRGAGRADRPGGRRPGLHLLLQGGLKPSTSQRLGHARDLPLGHLREERQRDRARGDVLGDGELALAVAEALAVEREQVDRRQVGLGRPRRASRSATIVSSRSTPRGSWTT